MPVGTLAILGLSAAGAAAGAGISGGLERLRQRRLDRTSAGRARQAELADARQRRLTGQYGFTESQRRQMLADSNRASQAARSDALAQQQAMAGTMGQGRSGLQTRMAAEIEKAAQQARADSAAEVNRLSQAHSKQQKAVDVALESSELDRQDMFQQRRAAARQRGAMLGISLGSAAMQSGLMAGATRAANAPAGPSTNNKLGPLGDGNTSLG